MIKIIIRKDDWQDLLTARLPERVNVEQLIEVIFKEVNKQNVGSTDS
jgi:acetyl-CoA carboxylase alpha subunit